MSHTTKNIPTPAPEPAPSLIERICALKVDGIAKPLGEALLLATEGNRTAKKALKRDGIEILKGGGVLIRLDVNPYIGEQS
ncbi:hypothetical protein [Rhodoferax sp.]|uniref:hypothetical protein n=1 Tax=Rhodoferax sp. TaxID=50421 RepID=UPI0025E33BE3|nr:hypothetical protein [Rhodoferax sp.]